MSLKESRLRKITIDDLKEMKRKNEKIVELSASDYNEAQMVSNIHLKL